MSEGAQEGCSIRSKVLPPGLAVNDLLGLYHPRKLLPEGENVFLRGRVGHVILVLGFIGGG